MACFIVPAVEAIVTTTVQKVIKKKENKNDIEKSERFSEKLGVLNGMLWGGSGLLAFEHLWHGEISLSFPFLTAASDPTQTAVMLHEMAVSGTSMALLVTAVWSVYLIITTKFKSKSDCDSSEVGI